MGAIDGALEIERLIKFGLDHEMIEESDTIPVRNGLLDLLKVSEPYCGGVPDEKMDSPSPILCNILDYASEHGILGDDTVTNRDLLDARIMGYLMPRQSEVIKKFWITAKEKGIKKATDDFYSLSKCSNYIRMDRINKNLYWRGKTPYGSLEITINLSKPEKDPRDIEAAKKAVKVSYPKCLLCLENVGYAGNINHPARQNHRVIPLTLNGEQWYFQYSPYVYYNEHCIVFYRDHVPMKISEKTFVRLFDFLEKFPHYFIGSNADIPIVGGSILSHEHFQGGRHIFPMEEAEVERKFINRDFPDVEAGIVKWPMSVIRLCGDDRDAITKLASNILNAWRDYSDESAGIFAYTKKDGETVSHNTITPIARRNARGKLELDLVLRNNRVTEEHPYGIFHPHRELHHIKKENIGLIEVMGLAVLPGRLQSELKDIERILTGEVIYHKNMYDESSGLYKHISWIEEMIKAYGTGLKREDARAVLEHQVCRKFSMVLEDAGVFKRDQKGTSAFIRFMSQLKFE